MRSLSPHGRKACMFGTLHVGIYCGCALLVPLRRYIKCTRVRDTNGWLVICEFEDHMHCMDEWGICLRCGRFRRILRTSYFAFEGSRFCCGPSVRACLRNWCTCSGHAKLKALLWVVLPHSLHPCIRGQSFLLWPFGSSGALAISALVLRTREAQSAFVGRATAFAAWSTFGYRVS